MGRKYISQINNENFVFPNNYVSEYDIEIVHDINDYSVTGVVDNFVFTSVSTTGITIQYDLTWSKNNADVFISDNGQIMLASIHMMAAGQEYYKPFRLVQYFSDSTTGNTTYNKTGSFTVLPSLMGLNSFSGGDYYFEVRFIGKRAVYPVCVNLSTLLPTPTPTSTPTPTPTTTSTPTTTYTPTVTCYDCYEYSYTASTSGLLQWIDCDGILTDTFVDSGNTYNIICPGARQGTVSGSGTIVQGTLCGQTCVTPTPTATPTPTSTPTLTPTSGCSTNWTVRNYDCGGGTINDVGINGSFMGTLNGPSNFPLSSGFYGTKSNPSGVICGSSNTIQANVTTNIAGAGNCAVLRVIINGVTPTPYETYFTSNPFPQVSGVIINSGDTVEVEVECYEGPCP